MTAKRAIKAEIPFAEQPAHVQDAAVYKIHLSYQRSHVVALILGVAIVAIPTAAALGLAVWVFRWVAGL